MLVSIKFILHPQPVSAPTGDCPRGDKQGLGIDHLNTHEAINLPRHPGILSSRRADQELVFSELRLTASPGRLFVVNKLKV